MSQGFIQVSEPLIYSKNQCIHIIKGQKKMICLLKGKLRFSKDNEVLSSGDVFGLEHIISLENIEEQFIALEESTIVSIEGQAIDELMNREKDLIHAILTLTVQYINEVKDNLLKGTTSCRP